MQLDVAILALVGIGLLALGVLVGMAAGRARGGTARRKVLELEMELKQAREAQAGYQDHVANHFEKTSEMVQKLTYQYREVYEHLAEGARELCPDRLPPLGRSSMEDALLTEVAGGTGAEEVEDDLDMPPSQLPPEPDLEELADDPEGLEMVLSDRSEGSPEVEFGTEIDDDAEALSAAEYAEAVAAETGAAEPDPDAPRA